MSGEDTKQFAGLQVPQLDLLVRAAAGEDPAIRTEGNGEYPVRVVEGMEGLSVGELPDPDGLIGPTACKELPVGAEGYGADLARVSGERPDRIPGARVPPFDREVG